MQLYNTKTRQLQEFIPITDKQVLLYTCGPTVYSSPQIGNWVSFLRWDILVRTLQAQGYTVTRVMNITDVGHLVSDADDGEDKMQKGARIDGTTAWQVAKKYTAEFLDGMHQLNCIMPTYITKATDFIPEQIALVQVLEQKGYTYVIDDGVYYDTSKFATYADFARLDLENIKEGARVQVNNQKRNPTDFALWKFSPKGEQRDMEWQSPWGVGFPGWHLECSAMALAKLGKTIDIHTGGIDHIQVHHTDEIAQSEAANEAPFANYWLHNNHMQVEGTKLSKSLGNSYTLQDIVKKGFTLQDFRLFVLQSQYRSENNFSWENLQAAHNRLQNWRHHAALAHQVIQPDEFIGIENLPDSPKQFEELETNHAATKRSKQAVAAFTAAMQHDMDTPAALTAVDDLLNAIDEYGMISFLLQPLTTMLQHVRDYLGLDVFVDDISTDQKELIAQRAAARDNKDWAASDKLRDELLQQGIELKDTKCGQVWQRT